MKLRLRVLVAIAFTLHSLLAFTQESSSITFNKIKPEDFSTKHFQVDTTAGAVILGEIGKSYFEGNQDGWFTLVHKVKRRIRIIDKKGFDLATVQVKLYRDKAGKAEELEDVKATTYNLENGIVVESKLNKEDVFKDLIDESHISKKFTMPAVKEGSLIEYSYTIKSDFLFNLQPWHFQGSYPTLWSEYEVAIPQFFDYVISVKGYLPFDLKKSSSSRAHYAISDPSLVQAFGANTKLKILMISANKAITRWGIKNVPALKEEKFTSSLTNHVSAVEFQLSGYNFPGHEYKPVMVTWAAATEELMKHKNFGSELAHQNKSIIKEMGLEDSSSASLNEAKRIFKYVQDNMSSKGAMGIFTSQSLKETFKNKSGTMADINLLLIMILKTAGFQASPVLISTRDNGVAHPEYPLIHKFNYVVCKVTVDNRDYFLDASQAYLGFNKLPSYCYNGTGRTIDKSNDAIMFSVDSLTENRSTSVTLMLDNENKKNWLGSVQSKMGYSESNLSRQAILKEGEEAVIKKIGETAKDNFKISNVRLVKLDKREDELMFNYDLEIDNANSNIIYFSPILIAGLTENPFKSEDRKYPVEMNGKMNDVYFLTLSIPEGYIIDEHPKSERVMFNENEGMFEYLVNKSATQITIKTVVQLYKATFPIEDYETLRKFFNHIVKKHAEQIVFKKRN